MPVRWYQLRRAALEADAFWIFIVGIVLSAPVSYLLTKLTNPNLATQLKYAGVLLETFGFGLVAMGIEQTRAQFGQPSTVALFRSWVRLIASSFGTPETHNLKIDAAAHGHISTGDVAVILGVPKDAPLEKRKEAFGCLIYA